MHILCTYTGVTETYVKHVFFYVYRSQGGLAAEKQVRKDWKKNQQKKTDDNLKPLLSLVSLEL